VDWIDPSAKVCLVERSIPPKWAGRKLTELDIATKSRVVAVTRLGVSQVPPADLVAQEGDIVFISVSGDHIQAFDQMLADGPGGGH
jgi:trk system potassium uptake protein TrkA